MKKIIIASMRKSVGKTSIIAGMAKVLDKKFGYIKPFGDRLIYKDKHLWDHDSEAITQLFGLEEKPQDLSIGFDYSKLRYLYDEEKTKQKLLEYGKEEQEVLFIETGRNLTYGSSVHLDPISIAKYTGAKLIMVLKGNEHSVDDITFVKKYLNLNEIDFGGIIVNQTIDIEDFKVKHLGFLEETGIKVLGILPFIPELAYFSMDYLVQSIPCKILAGEAGLNKIVKNIFIGAMSGHQALRNPLFDQENRLIITGGDRVDIILGALSEATSGIILTNNVVPPAGIISRAASSNIPLLLVKADTYKTANQVHGLEPLLCSSDEGKLMHLEEAVNSNLDLDSIF